MEQEKEVLLEMIHSIQNSQDMRQISDGELARRDCGGAGGRQRTGAGGVRRDRGGGGPGQGPLQPLQEKGRAALGVWVCLLTAPGSWGWCTQAWTQTVTWLLWVSISSLPRVLANQQ